jgi:hypothetical protein
LATPVDTQSLIAIVTVAASAGAAWAGVKAGLNGMRAASRETRASVKEISAALTHHVTADHSVQVLAAAASSRIETKVEALAALVHEIRQDQKAREKERDQGF